MLSASQDDDKIAWYANDGTGGFGPQQVISTLADGAMDVFATDLDGDGDQDVLSASLSDARIAWYMNDGTGAFGPQQVISTQAAGAMSVFATDLDGDGDQDVLSASFLDDKIAWYENLTTSIGVLENASKSDLRLFPNPMVEQAVVVLPVFDDPFTVQVLDATGRLVRDQRIGNTTGRFLLERADLMPGAYVLRILNPQQQCAARFMVK